MNAFPQIISPELVSCDFEKDYCNWKNETKNTQFNWMLDQAGIELKLNIFLMKKN